MRTTAQFALSSCRVQMKKKCLVSSFMIILNMFYSQSKMVRNLILAAAIVAAAAAAGEYSLVLGSYRLANNVLKFGMCRTILLVYDYYFMSSSKDHRRMMRIYLKSVNHCRRRVRRWHGRSGHSNVQHGVFSVLSNERDVSTDTFFLHFENNLKTAIINF